MANRSDASEQYDELIGRIAGGLGRAGQEERLRNAIFGGPVFVTDSEGQPYGERTMWIEGPPPRAAGGGGGSGGPGLPAGDSTPDNGPMESRITALETRLDTVLPGLATKADLADVRAEISKAAADTHKGFNDMVKWIVGTGFVGLAAMITIMTFVLNNAVPKAPATAQPPAVIINVPPAASAGPAPAAAPALPAASSVGR